jgi:hypothetical protein
MQALLHWAFHFFWVMGQSMMPILHKEMKKGLNFGGPHNELT